MANTNAIIMKALREKREILAANLERLDSLIAEFGGGAATAPAKRGRKPGTNKRTLTPDQIARMQAGRKKNREAKANGAGVPAPTPAQGASLAAAASE